MAATIIAFVSQKGGVGKSTMSRALAREAANNGLKAKIADLDTQQGTSVDWHRNRPLTPACSARFGTNEQLAVTRANSIRAQLEQKLLGERLQPSYLVLTSGPRHLETDTEGEGRRQDRAVDAWVAIDAAQVGSEQKP